MLIEEEKNEIDEEVEELGDKIRSMRLRELKKKWKEERMRNKKFSLEKI